MTRRPTASFLLLTAGLWGLWLLLAGGAAWLTGLVIALAGAAGTLWLLPRPGGAAARLRLAGLLRFLPYFIAESLLGGLDVAYRALHPAQPISPRFVTFELALRTPAARTLFLLILSLLPGTLAARLEGDQVRVHILTRGAEAGIARLQHRIADLFGENLSREGSPA